MKKSIWALSFRKQYPIFVVPQSAKRVEYKHAKGAKKCQKIFLSQAISDILDMILRNVFKSINIKRGKKGQKMGHKSAPQKRKKYVYLEQSVSYWIWGSEMYPRA